ncbi:MAG: hypothetical protein ACE361_13425 [Aureliella sp.]
MHAPRLSVVGQYINSFIWAVQVAVNSWQTYQIQHWQNCPPNQNGLKATMDRSTLRRIIWKTDLPQLHPDSDRNIRNH